MPMDAGWVALFEIAFLRATREYFMESLNNAEGGWFLVRAELDRYHSAGETEALAQAQ